MSSYKTPASMSLVHPLPYTSVSASCRSRCSSCGLNLLPRRVSASRIAQSAHILVLSLIGFIIGGPIIRMQWGDLQACCE